MSYSGANNRFSVLMDEPINKNNKITEKKDVKKEEFKAEENKLNYFKTDRQTIQKEKFLENKQRNEFRRQQDYDNRRMNNEEKIKKKKEEEIKILTNIDNFPELNSSSNKSKSNNCATDNIYFNKLLNISETSSIPLKSQSKTTNNIIHNDNIYIQIDEKEKKIKYDYSKDNIINKSKNEDSYTVMSRLVKLYRNRRSEHIRKWGIDEYEHMFMFPNYDYQYYDKIDEIYDYYNDNYKDYSYEYEYDYE